MLQIVSRPKRRDEEPVLPEERLSRSLPGWAEKQGIPIRREDRPGGDRFREQIEALAPDLGLVVSYGRRFPTSLLDVPKRGWLKVHFSLLPKHRGCIPFVRLSGWATARPVSRSFESPTSPMVDRS